MRWSTAAGFATATLAAIGWSWFVSAPDAVAKGGGGGGGGATVDPGTVYYAYWPTSGSGTYWAKMNTDGTGKTNLPPGVSGTPSGALHGGERWFLSLQNVSSGPYYDEGSWKGEVFAVNESGTKRVQLTDGELAVGDPIVPDHALANYWAESVRWAVDGATSDGKISYLGYRLHGTTNDTWGLCTLVVDWSRVTAGTWSPAAPTLIGAIDEFRARANGPGWYQNVIYAWSPDGTEFAYEWINATGDPDVWCCTVSTKQLAKIYTGCVPCDWSALGRIACVRVSGGSWSEIISMNRDGSSVATVVPAARSAMMQHGNVCWSAAGNYLVYCLRDDGSNRGSAPLRDVHRVAANGAGDTNLTGDTVNYAWPTGWR
jgi:hypothetical protein